MTTFRSHADVATATPARYAKQLVAHLGRRIEWRVDGDTATAGFGGGVGTVIAGDGVLTLTAEAPDETTLDTIENVLGSHLERFGQRQELAVHWQRQDLGD